MRCEVESSSLNKDVILQASQWQHFVARLFFITAYCCIHLLYCRFIDSGPFDVSREMIWAHKGELQVGRVRIEGNSISTSYVLYTVSL